MGDGAFIERCANDLLFHKKHGETWIKKRIKLKYFYF